MSKIIIDDRVYKTHPIFTLYACSKDGYIIHIVKQRPFKGNKINTGYMIFSVRKYGESKQTKYCAHKFVWETFNGKIPEGFEIDHIDNNKMNNKLSNLQLLTHTENCKKAAASYRDFKLRFKNRKFLEATNKQTKKVSYYFSFYSAGQHLQINRSSVWKVCQGVYKSALSKKDGNCYRFKYVDEDLPVEFIKSKNIRPRKRTDEQIKERKKNYQTKDWSCPNCDKVFRNCSKYRHIKKCNSKQ